MNLILNFFSIFVGLVVGVVVEAVSRSNGNSAAKAMLSLLCAVGISLALFVALLGGYAGPDQILCERLLAGLIGYIVGLLAQLW